MNAFAQELQGTGYVEIRHIDTTHVAFGTQQQVAMMIWAYLQYWCLANKARVGDSY